MTGGATAAPATSRAPQVQQKTGQWTVAARAPSPGGDGRWRLGWAVADRPCDAGRGELHDTVLKAIRANRAAWRAWLEAEGLAAAGPDPGRHPPAARLAFYRQLGGPQPPRPGANPKPKPKPPLPGSFAERCGLNCACCAPASVDEAVGDGEGPEAGSRWGETMPRWG